MRQKTETLSERVAVKIRQYIIENEMKAGDRLPNELQMAEYCEVGRGTVRDAVKLLRFEGLVEVVQGSGTYLLRQKQKPIETAGERRQIFWEHFCRKSCQIKRWSFQK